MVTFPLIRHSRADAVFAFRGGRRIDAGQFLRDVTQLARELPDRRHQLNLCVDRYTFAVGFSAALLRRQLSLLPPNRTPDLLAQLRLDYPDLYCLVDDASEPPPLPTIVCAPSASAGEPMPPVPTFPGEQTAALVFTSGSTGAPVAHRKTWASLVASAHAEGARLRVGELAGLALLATVPPQHMYGIESSVLMAMQNGFGFHAGRPFYPADIRAALTALPRPRGLVTTPVHLRALLSEGEPLPPIDFLLSATAPLAPQLAVDAETRFGAPLHEIYGCTEAGQVATRRTVATPEWRTFDGLTLRQDEQGTWVNGGHVEDEVLLADVIELIADDRFLLHGRTADLVNIAGKRTSLANLNYHLNSITGVDDGVFVMPADGGAAITRLTAFVVAPTLSVEALLAALRNRIDPAFLPRPLCLVAALPRNTTGKLPRQAVDELVRRSTDTGDA